jgi:hypothetical protein
MNKDYLELKNKLSTSLVNLRQQYCFNALKEYGLPFMPKADWIFYSPKHNYNLIAAQHSKNKNQYYFWGVNNNQSCWYDNNSKLKLEDYLKIQLCSILGMPADFNKAFENIEINSSTGIICAISNPKKLLKVPDCKIFTDLNSIVDNFDDYGWNRVNE